MTSVRYSLKNPTTQVKVSENTDCYKTDASSMPDLTRYTYAPRF